ncbi:MAG: hypothetical protein ABII00_17680 [Elusimicrobiota bacterium]
MRLKFGFASYRPEQWERLRSISEDKDDLEDTYDEWLPAAQTRFEELKRSGTDIVQVEVDVEDLVGWCRSRNLSINAQSRSQFAAHKLRELDAE